MSEGRYVDRVFTGEEVRGLLYEIEGFLITNLEEASKDPGFEHCVKSIRVIRFTFDELRSKTVKVEPALIPRALSPVTSDYLDNIRISDEIEKEEDEDETTYNPNEIIIVKWLADKKNKKQVDPRLWEMEK